MGSSGFGPARSSMLAMLLGCFAATGIEATGRETGERSERESPIVVENRREGARDWQLTRVRHDPPGFRSPWIEGYCSKQSVAAGEEIEFFVSTSPAAKFQIEIFRMGYYGGAGARLMETLGPFAYEDQEVINLASAHSITAADGTYFYSSPKHPSAFRLAQILQGGAVGMTVCARGNSLQIGREGGDLNFPGDLYMSGSHCRIEEREGHFTLTDMTSRNGTYLRLKSERELGHGDYLFIGRKLLRVELNTN